MYVPVAVGPTTGVGGGFPLNNLGISAFNPGFSPGLFPGFSPGLSPTLTPGLSGAFNPGITPAFGGFNQPGFPSNQDPFDNRRPESTFGPTTRTSNPFGFNLGKQTTDVEAIKITSTDNSLVNILMIYSYKQKLSI